MRYRNKKDTKLTDVKKQIDACDIVLFRTHSDHMMLQRNIEEEDVYHVLEEGEHEPFRDQWDTVNDEWKYAARGYSLDEDEMRVVIKFGVLDGDNTVVVITAIKILRRSG